ncbi:MAG: tRNA (adenosine(37)-N6)-dimethylallyltransferase MiaA [Desulfobulbaceae bacterium]|jgi:tRNA dimethylallyltransferase|nr:tRNA (adenosine(37)-N6)-dimethylallyltransferase MiaA [Desulfobulbaceae bacterium]
MEQSGANIEVASGGASPVLVLVGPTAVGKTALSLRIARRFHCEIISLDSMQVYRHLDIGTAKISQEEMGGIAHYCLDVVEPDEDYNAARYVLDARAAITMIRAAGKIPLLVGGSGLYLRALEHGLFAAPPFDTHIRKELEKQIETEGIEKLHQELSVCDPETAARIARRDRARVLRALEVFRATGLPLSAHLQRQHRNGAAANNGELFIKIGLDCPRDLLYRRIEERCRTMLDEGLIDETRRALAAGVAADCQALKAIGYRHVLSWLRGENDYEKMLELFMRDSRRYAKRQFTWFRHDPEIAWFDHRDEGEIIAHIVSSLQLLGKKPCPDLGNTNDTH